MVNHSLGMRAIVDRCQLAETGVPLSFPQSERCFQGSLCLMKWQLFSSEFLRRKSFGTFLSHLTQNSHSTSGHQDDSVLPYLLVDPTGIIGKTGLLGF